MPYLAIDMGASNIRLVLGRLHQGRLTTDCIHRVEHHATLVDGHLRWDWARLMDGIHDGLDRLPAHLQPGEQLRGISADSWGPDFGLLGADERLIYPPVSYRDSRTHGLPDGFAEVIEPLALRQRVGGAISPVTTLCQLVAMRQQEPEVLAKADRLLHVADLVHHALCGARSSDWTYATLSQMHNLRTDHWDDDLLTKLDLPTDLLPEALTPPTIIGHLPAAQAPHPALADVPVIATAGHDTAAATAALPDLEPGTTFLSLGTWAMLGCCVAAPSLPETISDRGLMVIGLADRRWGWFHGGMGLWLLQECRRLWAADGHTYSYQELATAAQASACRSRIAPNHNRFFAPEQMINEIRQACREQHQAIPKTPGDIGRVIVESLADSFRHSLNTLSDLTGHPCRKLYVVGGGSRHALLMQRLADALGVPVHAVSAEATAIGNLLLQAQATGELAGAAERQALAGRTLTPIIYMPEEAL